MRPSGEGYGSMLCDCGVELGKTAKVYGEVHGGPIWIDSVACGLLDRRLLRCSKARFTHVRDLLGDLEHLWSFVAYEDAESCRDVRSLSLDEELSTGGLSSYFDTKQINGLAFIWKWFEIIPTVRSKVMPVFVEAVQSVTRRKQAEP